MPRLTVGRVTTAVGVGVAVLRLLAPWSLNLFDLKVVDLRHRARQIENFPLKGRELSTANRDELLAHFRALGYAT